MQRPGGPFGAGSLVAEAEVSAERTVALLRMGLAMLLGVVFVVSVIGAAGRMATEASEQLPLLPKVWTIAVSAMSAYFALGAAVFLAIRAGWYRPWVSWAAATGDVLFCVGNAWLSLESSEAPANYIGAMPSFWLAPMALAFGSLRYNPALQLYILALLVSSTLFVAVFGPDWRFDSTQGAPDVVAFFYAIPPNVMRLAMIVGAGGVLIVASLRAKALLVRAVREASAHQNLTRYLPAGVAERAAATGLDALRQGERRIVAALFTDMRGFTRLSQSMAPAEIGAFLAEHRRRITRVVEAEGGVVDKFIGDAALVVFGLDLPGTPAHDHRRHAAAALRCAVSIVAEMEDWSRERAQSGDEPVRVGVGVHYGEVYSGAIGDDARLEFTVLGDTVNVASRLEAVTKQMNVPAVASAEAIEAAGASVGAIWRAAEEVTLPGRVGTIRVHALAPEAAGRETC